MKPSRRPALACVFLFAMPFSAWASTAFVRAPSATTPELAPVRTYAGDVQPSLKPLKFDAAVTAVVLADTLTPENLDLAKSELLSFQGFLKGRPLHIALIRNGAVGMAGPFATRAKLKATLDEISPAATDAASQVVPTSFFDLLLASVGQWQADGAHVVLVGDLPALDSATADYASAALLQAFAAHHLQVSWFAPAGGGANWFPLFEATGGKILHDSLGSYPAFLNEAGQTYLEVNWTPAAPPEGFVVSRTVISDQQGSKLGEVPDISASSPASLPTIELYADMEEKTSEAEALLGVPLTEASAKEIHEKLASALDVNSRDASTLRVAAIFYEGMKDYATAVKLRSALVEVRPADGSAYADLGHVSLLAGDMAKSDAALRRAVELNVNTPLVSEDLARVHLSRKEDKDAIPLLDAALVADSSRQDLWFLEAEAAQRSQDSALAIRALEQGLGLGGVHVPEASSLLHLYVSTKQDQKASALGEHTISTLPGDLTARESFAATLDDLHLSSLALEGWRRVLEVQPGRETAHIRIARLLLESGNAPAAEKAANAGLTRLPKSAGLYLVKADTLQAQRQSYKARAMLQEGAAKAADPALLSRLALTEDAFGDSAPASYARLAESLDGQSPDRMPALERGLAVSLRDGDLTSAKAFESKLEASGQKQFRGLLEAQAEADEYEVIPGGLDALSFAAHMPEHIPPDKFFLEYCQTLVSVFGPAAAPDKKIFESQIQDHFQRITQLEPFGKRDNDKLIIELSLSNQKLRKNTEKVLSILGIKLRRTKGETEVEESEKKSQSKKQETASALAIDEVGIQEAFQAGKPYTIEIPYEKAMMYPSRKLWQPSLAQGGFVMAALKEPKLASLYIALSYLDRKTVSALLSAVSLNTLTEHYSDLMYLYSPALAVENGHAMVPGGTKAERIWADMVGVSPAEPGAFFRALLDHDGGKLLAFYFTLSQLDRAHQAFFTDHQSRTAQFYKLFASSNEMERGAVSATKDSPLRELLRGVPLDKNGRVNFPGSAQVWMVAKGRSVNVSDTSKLMKQVSKVAPPEVEDEVLLRLGETQYSEKGSHVSELDNFLAVARIDAHRSKPLDEESALLLAQRYSSDSKAYAYFTDLTFLSAAELRLFFSVIDRIKGYSPLDANLRLGEFHALIEWLCLMNRRGALDGGDAAELFKFVCARFAAASVGAAYTSASLESTRAILAHCSHGEDKSLADDQLLRACLLGPGRASGKRGQDYERVLEDQKAPRLLALFTVYDAMSKLSANPSPAPSVASTEKALASLPSISLPKDSKVRGKEKDGIDRYETVQAVKLGMELEEKTAKRKVNRNDLDKLSSEILAQLEPQVTLALVGPIYAYFLRPTDLVESADALLLRKHHYFNFAVGDRENVNAESYFHKDAEGAGSYLEGGFAEFPLAVGLAATTGWKDSAGVGESSVAELATIRATVWERLDESDQRLLSLRILAAREWIFEAANHPELFTALADETLGLLSLTRRADLLNGIETRNWGKAWDAVTLPDLVSLGGKYLERFDKDPWSSPVTSALRAAAAKNDGEHLEVLGPLSYHTFGCGHPHLLVDSPYEEYQRQLIPEQIAERSAEFKLFLAFLADRAGIDPGSLEDVAEVLVGRAFRGAKMASAGDWRALLAAYASVTPDDLKKALEQ